jgi:hypothetical protein
LGDLTVKACCRVVRFGQHWLLGLKRIIAGQRDRSSPERKKPHPGHALMDGSQNVCDQIIAWNFGEPSKADRPRFFSQRLASIETNGMKVGWNPVRITPEFGFGYVLC